MTAETAIASSVLLLEKLFGMDTRWHVRVIDEWPGRPDVRGHCSEENCITLVEKYLGDDRVALDTICHECAHALAGQDFNHGTAFKAALERVRKVARNEY